MNVHSVWLVCFYTAFCLYVCILFLCATILVAHKTLLVVFGQVELTAHGLKSRLVFARAVCWPQTHLPQAWIGGLVVGQDC